MKNVWFLVLAAGLIGMALVKPIAVRAGLPFSKEDFDKACEALGLSEVKIDKGLVFVKERNHNRTLLVTTVVTIEGRTTFFENVEKNDSVFVVEDLAQFRGATFTRAKSMEALDKGKFKEEKIFGAGEKHIFTPNGKGIADKIFFYEASTLVGYQTFMPFTSIQGAGRGLSKVRWFNVAPPAATDSLNKWANKYCGPGAKPEDVHADGMTGFAYMDCKGK